MTLQLVTFRRSKTEVALKSSVKHESRLLLTVTLFIFPSVTKWHYFEMTVEICQTRLSERSKSLFFVLRGTLFIIFKSPIIHLVYPPKILHNLCFSFRLGVTAVLREFENNTMQNFEGQIRCILGDMQVANTSLVRWRPPFVQLVLSGF